MADEIINVKQIAICETTGCTEYAHAVPVDIALDADLVCGACGNMINNKTVI